MSVLFVNTSVIWSSTFLPQWDILNIFYLGWDVLCIYFLNRMFNFVNLIILTQKDVSYNCFLSENSLCCHLNFIPHLDALDKHLFPQLDVLFVSYISEMSLHFSPQWDVLNISYFWVISTVFWKTVIYRRIILFCSINAYFLLVFHMFYGN